MFAKPSTKSIKYGSLTSFRAPAKKSIFQLSAGVHEQADHHENLGCNIALVSCYESSSVGRNDVLEFAPHTSGRPP